MKKLMLILCLVFALSACSIKNTELTTVTTTDNQTTTEVVNTVETNIIKDGVDVFIGGASFVWDLVKDGFAFFSVE